MTEALRVWVHHVRAHWVPVYVGGQEELLTWRWAKRANGFLKEIGTEAVGMVDWLRRVLMKDGVLTCQDCEVRLENSAVQRPVVSQEEWTCGVASWHSLQMARVVKEGKTQVPLVQVKKGRISKAVEAFLVSGRRAAL